MIETLLLLSLPPLCLLAARKRYYSRLSKTLLRDRTTNGPVLSGQTTLGELIDCLDLPEGEVRAEAMCALTELLPTLRSGNALLLNALQRHTLYLHLHDTRRPQRDYHLYIPRYTKFVLATLDVIPLLADSQAIVHVERLAETTTYDNIKQAALRCLTALREEIKNVDVRENLLRPTASTPASAILLRPASGSHPKEGAEELLRGSGPAASTED